MGRVESNAQGVHITGQRSLGGLVAEVQSSVWDMLTLRGILATYANMQNSVSGEK